MSQESAGVAEVCLGAPDMGAARPFVSHDKFNNVFRVRHRSFGRGSSKVFRSHAAAIAFVALELGRGVQRGSIQTKKIVLKAMSKVYGRRSPLMPADLRDAISRHCVDSDIFLQEPGAEILSIMLKYQPVRCAFSTALRRTLRPQLMDNRIRATRLWQCLRSAVLEVSKCGS